MLTNVTDCEFNKIKQLVYEVAGIYLKDSKKPLVSNRLRKRVNALGLDSYMKYCNYMMNTQDGKKELQNFIDALTTNETFFFRNTKHFEFLENVFLPELIKTKVNKNIRIWSAACSTGEEPYSIAMLIREKLPDFKNWNIQITASDINKNVLAEAAAGIYKPRAIEKMPHRYLSKYFLKVPGKDLYYLSNEIKDMVSFYRHNLMERFIYGNYDCVFCRNVMIYFDNDSKTRVYEHLMKALRTYGYLIIGHAESLIKCDLPFKYVQPAIYRKI